MIPGIDLSSNVTHDTIEVSLSGELDMSGAFQLEPEIDRLLREHAVDRLVVDLGDVRFVDSAGLGALLSTHERAKDAGVDLTLANPSDPIRRILKLTGTGDALAD
jgi:anti-anti-sigma factor